MPPKPKFTREEIAEAALNIVSRQGLEALTARELGKELGSSARPIFTVFKNMGELLEAVRTAARRRFESFAEKTAPNMPIFKRAGMQMVLFGMQEPKLYQMLYLQEEGEASGFDGVFGRLGTTAQMCVDAICRDYGMGETRARRLFENVWIYTLGVGALCATRACRFSEEELSDMLSTEFRAMLLLLRFEEQGDSATAAPDVPNASGLVQLEGWRKDMYGKTISMRLRPLPGRPMANDSIAGEKRPLSAHLPKRRKTKVFALLACSEFRTCGSNASSRLPRRT